MASMHYNPYRRLRYELHMKRQEVDVLRLVLQVIATLQEATPDIGLTHRAETVFARLHAEVEWFFRDDGHMEVSNVGGANKKGNPGGVR
jgi:hypothetical protein